MKDKLIAVLEQFCPDNVYLQGTLNENEAFPAEFLTFWTDSTGIASSFDNHFNSVNWTFSVNYYSSDPQLVATKPALISAALQDAGFIPQGIGFDLPSGVDTHTGWAMDFIITEYL